MPSDYANDLMGRVGLDTTEWKKGITDLNAGIKHIETGFQAAAALMDDWSNNSDGLRMRIETLNDKLALQKKKLDILKKAYEEEVAKNGESSKAAEELAKKMFDAQNEIKRTTGSIEKYSKAEDAATKQTKAFIAQLEASGKKLNDYGEKISSVGNKFTLGVTTPVLAAGTAIYKYSSDLPEAENKTDATFGRMSHTVKQWAQDSLDNMGMAKSTALDAVSLYGDMATSMGLTLSKASDMSMTLVQLSADLSSFKNVSLEQAQNALKGIFTGETESLKNLGIVMNETQLKSYAMSKGFEKNYEDLSQAEKVQLRYEYVLEKSANALGDYGKTSGEAAGQMRKLPEALKELATSSRDNVEPVITPIITTINKAIVSFGKLDAETKKTIVTVAGVAAAIGPIVSVGGKLVSTVGKIKTAVAAVKKWQMARSLKQTKTAMDAVKTSTEATTIATRGLGAAMKSAVPLIGAVLLVLGALRDAYNDAKQEMIDEINERYDAELKKAEETYESEIKIINDIMNRTETARQESTEKAQKDYEARVKAAEEYVKVTKDQIKKEQEIKQKAHKEVLKMIDEERKTRKKAVDDATNAANEELQAQIDAIDAQIEFEEKAKKESEDAQRLRDLQTAVAAARTIADKRNAEKALAEFVAEQEAEKTAAAREELKKQLQDRIDANNDKASAQKELIDKELDAAEQAAEDAYELYKESIDNRLEYLEGYVEKETGFATIVMNDAIEKAETTANKELELYQKLLDDKEKAYKQHLDDMEAARKNETDEAEPSMREVLLDKWDKSYFGRASAGTDRLMIQHAWDILSDEDKQELINRGYAPPGNANGTNFWRGGFTRLNEEGGEILNLPRGTQIIPHDVSMEMARAYGNQAAITNSNNTTNTTNTTNNSYNYGAQQQVTVLEVSGQKIATVIQPTVSVGLARSNRSRERALGRSASK